MAYILYPMTMQTLALFPHMHVTMRRFSLSAITTFLITTLLAPALFAQGGQRAPTPQKTPEPKIDASDVTEQDMEAAAALAVEVRKVQMKYLPKMKKMMKNKSRKKMMQMRRKMGKEIKQTIKVNDKIGQERFRQMQLLAKQDTTFRKKLMNRIKAKTKAMRGGMQQQQQGQNGKNDEEDGGS